MTTTYEALIGRVTKPARYTGGELHSVVKQWDAHAVRVVLAYPDLYDLGMSNLGLAILYDVVNRRDDALCERVFSPWTDFEALLRASSEPLRSLETRHPVREFDLLGISLQYEVCATNVLNLIDLAGIPVHTADRAGDDTIVIAGGSVALEPEPFAPFFDAFALGEGEEVLGEIVDLVRDWKAAGGGPRLELHRALAGIPGVYVPSLYEPRYRDDPSGGRRAVLEGTYPIDGAAPERVTRRVMQTLPPPLTKPIVPFMEVVHDRAVIEIQRGCTQGCRFCQAGMIYRPTRERSVEEIVRAAGELLDNTGYRELSLMSLSTTDHRDIVPMLHALMDAYGDRGLKISIPSTRVDSFSVEVADAIARSDFESLRDELGDLLLQVVFHARMAEEGGHFDFHGVVDGISDKLVRRHPHVFGDDDQRLAGAQDGSWERIKAKERTQSGDPSALAGIAKAMPALTRAQKLGKRAAHVGFDWPDRDGVRAKIFEELQELEDATGTQRPVRIEEELGDLLFAVVNLARHLDVDAETALAVANIKFGRRFRDMEQAFRSSGAAMQDSSLELLESEWRAAKKRLC